MLGSPQCHAGSVTYVLLVNPRAGGATASAATARSVLVDAGHDVDVVRCQDVATTQAQVAAACARGDVVVAVGGDGTLSSVAGLVAAHGGVLGLLPAGRGNDFARMLGVPSDAAAAARVLLHGRVEPVDLIAC